MFEADAKMIGKISNFLNQIHVNADQKASFCDILRWTKSSNIPTQHNPNETLIFKSFNLAFLNFDLCHTC